MLRMFKLCSPALCLLALAIFATHAVKADDTATTKPSDSNGSIVVTVLDSDSKPVAKARVQLFTKKKATEGDDAAPAKPKALARGSTDDDGKFTFSSLASGEYKVNASVKKAGTKGTATVSITDDAPNGTVTINLSAPADAGNGAAPVAPAK
jgi:hypothetical protein